MYLRHLHLDVQSSFHSLWMPHGCTQVVQPISAFPLTLSFAGSFEICSSTKSMTSEGRDIAFELKLGIYGISQGQSYSSPLPKKPYIYSTCQPHYQ